MTYKKLKRKKSLERHNAGRVSCRAENGHLLSNLERGQLDPMVARHEAKRVRYGQAEGDSPPGVAR